jgi:MFS family permease
MALIAGALALFATSPVDGIFVRDVMPAMLLLGAGSGIAFPALMNLAMSGAKPEEAGLASGLVNTSAQVGGALGLAVLATLSSSRTDALREGGQSLASALTSGYHLAYLIGAALVLAAIAVGLTVVKSDRPGAERFGGEPVAEAA